jgi:uncharacterized RDD family membrane protein YckC
MISDLQKANMFKRISAGLFDFITTCIVIVAITLLLSTILGYDNYKTSLDASYAKYEEQYNIKFSMSEEERAAMSEADLKRYDEAYEALIADDEAMYTYNMIINLTLLITSLGIFIGMLITEFIVPLVLGNGQTLGKKIFGIALMRTDGIKITGVMLFVRSILGKYTLETMIPVLVVIMILFNMTGIEGTIVLFGIVVLQIIVMCVTGTRSLVHDLIACTVAVDHASQRIFDSPEEQLEYKKRIHAQQASEKPY